MRVLILFNPVSGRGRAASCGESIVRSLRAASHEVEIAHTRLEPTIQWLDPVLNDVDALVVAGGDGAVRLAADAASRTQTPIYHVPCGTENLLAREFGMSASAPLLLQALERYQVRSVDMGVANGRVFLLMVSVGYDAEVVHDLAGARGSSISHWTYVKPVLRQLRRWRPPRLTIEVDGERIAGPESPDAENQGDGGGGGGFVVVANSRHYGWRLNPCGRASIDDGRLDVAFFATGSRLGLLRWVVRSRLQRHLDHRDLVYRVGQRVLIRSDEPQRYQLDGDPPEATGVGGADSDELRRPLHLEITIRPGALRVLAP